MKKYINILKKTILFAGISEEEIASLLTCLKGELKTYKKASYVLHQGEQMHRLAILVKGALLIQREDYWGNCSIINHVGVGEMFGESFLAPNSGAMPNDVIAQADSTVIFFDVSCILTTCSNSCRFHAMVTENLFYAISEKNRRLVQKLGHMSKRTTREKLISYLSEEAKRHGSSHFSIPFNRQQLADFLSVDRSAMSNELCKMRDEGLLIFNKNQFTLNQKDD